MRNLRTPAKPDRRSSGENDLQGYGGNAPIKTVVKKMRKIKVRKQTADVHKPAVSGGSIDFTDVLLLLKIDGEWKCVAKAYNQNPNTIKK